MTASSGSTAVDQHSDRTAPGIAGEEAAARPRTGAAATDGSGSQPAAVRTTGLTKRFRSQVAVDHVDLEVPTGSVYGFLGPNGSGKTTTIRMLLGLIGPTAGQIEVLGGSIATDSRTILPRIGALVEGPAFHPYLSGRSNLERIDATDRGADPATAKHRIDAALDRVGLLAAASKRYRAYSLGMRQRLAIASALLMPRDLLILDEPTNGLDPQGTREVRHLVAALADEGATVLVSSHLLSEVEQVCTHIGVMHEGRLLSQGTMAALRAGARPQVRVETTATRDAAAVLTELGVADVQASGDSATGTLGEVTVERVVPALVRAGVPVTGFAVVAPSLEDVFVGLTGEGFDVSG